MPFRFRFKRGIGLRIWLVANLPAPLRDLNRASNNLDAGPSVPHRSILADRRWILAVLILHVLLNVANAPFLLVISD
jgi:hypothetical protein